MKNILLSLALLSPTLLAERYFRPPEMDKTLFESKLIALDKFDRAAVVGNLITVARDFPEQKGMSNDLRSQVLAIAGRLDPNSKRFKKTLEAVVSEGGAYRDSSLNPDQVQLDLYDYATTLAAEGSDSQVLAAYLVDIARRFHPEGPHSTELLTLQETLSGSDKNAEWEGLLLAPVRVESNNPWEEFLESLNRFKPRQISLPGGKADGVVKNQASVLGLCTLTLPSGREVGDGLRVMLSALPEKKATDVLIVINQDVGQGVNSSLEELEKFVRLRHPVLPSGYRWEIVFETKLDRGSVDGNSCGLAMALLLDTVMSGHVLDEKFCCTGAITSDGRVEAIGGVVQKMKAAIRREAQVAVLPKANRKQIGDLILSEGMQPILDLEIFTVTKYDEALALASAEQQADLAEARKLYASIVKVVDENGEEILSNEKVRQRIDQVLAKAPNHLSAAYLKELSLGNKPTQLSVPGSLDSIHNEVQTVLNKLGDFYRLVMQQDADTIIDGSEFSIAARSARTELLDKQKQLDSVTEPVVAAAVDFLEVFIEMTSVPTPDEFRSSYEKYAEAYGEVALDPEYR